MPSQTLIKQREKVLRNYLFSLLLAASKLIFAAVAISIALTFVHQKETPEH